MTSVVLGKIFRLHEHSEETNCVQSQKSNENSLVIELPDSPGRTGPGTEWRVE